jgi:L-alanine-DL-glutamate epimerase-like enolase superfamily enzyme
MRITGLDLIVIGPGSTSGWGITVSAAGRIAQKSGTWATPIYEQWLRVRTDEGIDGLSSASSSYITAGVTPVTLDLLRQHVIGEDPLERERLFQLLHRGGRFLYQKPGWFGAFDNCLWDIAGKVAGLPIHRLIGQVRDSIPAYLYPVGHMTAEDLGREMPGYVEWARDTLGVPAMKVGSRQGLAFDIALHTEVRKRAGDDFVLMSDGGAAYSLRESKELGLALEDLGYLWFEEPMYEQEMRWYKDLKRTLTRIPILANEMLMYDMNISTQWLLEGVTDLLRANAGNGATAVLKMAHLAELMGTTIELNSQGGLGGHVHTQLQCAISNTQFYEYPVGGQQMKAGLSHGAAGRELGIVNAPEIEGGRLKPSMEPGWGAVIDWEYVDKRTVAVL